MLSPSLKLIIFDWDDVITLGSKEGYLSCYHAAIEAVGIHLEPEEEHRRLLKQWSRSHVDELGELLREHPELVERAGQVYLEHLFGGTFVQSLKPVPGVFEMLTRLQGRFRLAIATGMHPKLLREQVIPRLQINPRLFAQLEFGYDVPSPAQQKPHPYMVQKILRTQGVSTKETILVGDAEADIEMAQAAQVEPVAVLTGQLDRSQAKKLGVSIILDDVTQLEALLP